MVQYSEKCWVAKEFLVRRDLLEFRDLRTERSCSNWYFYPLVVANHEKSVRHYLIDIIFRVELMLNTQIYRMFWDWLILWFYFFSSYSFSRIFKIISSDLTRTKLNFWSFLPDRHLPTLVSGISVLSHHRAKNSFFDCQLAREKSQAAVANVQFP